MDLASARARLEPAKGRDYWRSLEELAEADGFDEMVHREFPRQASEWDGGDEGRRNFLKLMGASLALGGLSACTRQPEERIYPYVNAPESMVPGKPLFYATAFSMSGYSTGILMESHAGRPTKVEGNPLHPASLGATDVMAQASVLNLYDPDRSQTPNFLGEIRSYSSFVTAVRQVLDEQGPKNGAGLRILTETIGSPTLADQMKTALAAFPAAKWIQWEPLGQAVRQGSKLAFGQYVNTFYKFDAADVVVSLDSDFLCVGPASARYSRDFAAKRRVREGRTSMSRFYAIETTPQTSNAKADHRAAVKPSEMEGVVRALASALGVAGASGSAGSVAWLPAMVKDLQAHVGASVVVAGDEQSAEVHALVHAINSKLGNVGKTVVYTDPIESNPSDQLADLKTLAADLDSGAVDILIVLGGNPIYDAPVDLALKDKFPKAKLRVRYGLYQDETSALCQWHIPAAHPLESWGDGRAFDGTATILQPLIAPLYDGRSPYEMLAIFGDNPVQAGYDVVRQYWQKQHTGADFDTWWRRSVHDGVIADSAVPVKTLKDAIAPPPSSAPAAGEGLEVSFHPDPYVYDGRFANNGWLQELPRPLTRLTWDNAVMVSPATAKKLSLATEDVVELKHGDNTVWGAIWVMPGQPDDSLGLNVGFGRTHSGRAGNGAGFDAYKIRKSNSLGYMTGVSLKKMGKKFKLASEQTQGTMEGRPVARIGTIAEYIKNSNFAREMNEAPGKGETIYPESWRYEGYAWGMSIDLTACVGCNACVVACQSENNIAIVGKDQIGRGRNLHWLRIDRYYAGKPENPEVVFEPVACVHCENAPCEIVCPVAATLHDQDGINNMIYNRCVGTRYCSNNCPYKVRRFNFYLYSDWDTESLKLQKNPDVSVRSRGVMEKCSYCIQRINYAKITAEREDRKVVDGEVITACQAACPAQAISFGDLNDPNSEVRKQKQEGLSYGLLAELNTRPRTTHMAAIRNPNPEIEAS